MTYPTLATVNATSDLTNLLVYVNDLTDGYAMPGMLIAFFFVVFLGGTFAQFRFGRQPRIDVPFAVAGFVTFGLAVLLSLRNGLLSPAYLLISLAVAILGAVWLYLSSE